MANSSVPRAVVYELSGAEIGTARVATREVSGGGQVGATCFYDEDIVLLSMTVMIDIPEPPSTEPLSGPYPVARSLTDEEQLTSRRPTQYMVVGGAPPLFLLESR